MNDEFVDAKDDKVDDFVFNVLGLDGVTVAHIVSIHAGATADF